MGYNAADIPIVKGKTRYKIVLHDNLSELDEVVVIGYASQRKVDLTGSVSSINTSALSDRPITNTTNALAGLAAGLTVTNSGGNTPGFEAQSILVRGRGTLNDAAPLIVVDGMTGIALSDINPQDIENISVLKDAASAAIYGSRAANGVILVTTRQGSERATKGAAYALRGKVYLFNRQWDRAIDDFEEVVYNKSNNYGYSLHNNYNELFRLYNGNHSPEMIFSIQSIDGNTAGYALNIVGYFGNKSTMRLIAGNCIVPSTTLVDMYENIDGSPFNWDDVFPGFNDGDSQLRRKYLSVAIDQGSTVVTSTLDCDTTKVMDIYRLRDPRLCLNVITPYSHYLGTDAGSQPMDKQFVLADPSKGGAPMEAMAFIRNSEGWNSYFWRKWIPTGNLDGYWGEYNRTPYEFPLIRLGDVILMLAEAYNETGATDKAIVEANKIRSRVGMPTLNNGDEWLAVNSKEDMAERIRRERAFELAGEGQRYWDLCRWGLLEKSVKNATDIFGDLMYTRSYQTRHELWPIPLVEMERNHNLTQNNGWE